MSTDETILRYIVPDGSGAMDARLATVNSAGTVTWLHTDHQGSVIATSNDSGEVVEAVSYSPYGEFGPGQTAPPEGSPFGYTGRQFDVETGLYQYRARYFHTRLGVFLSTDPIGTQDDPNLYMYVGLDPVNKTDPTGRKCEMIGSGRTSRLSCWLDEHTGLTRDEVRVANRAYTAAANQLLNNTRFRDRTAFVYGQNRRVSGREVLQILTTVHVRGDGGLWNRAEAQGGNSSGGSNVRQMITIGGLSIRRDERGGTSNIHYDLQNQFVHEAIHLTRNEPRNFGGDQHKCAYIEAADRLLAPRLL